MGNLLITWAPTGWPHKMLRARIDRFRQHGFVEEDWRILSHKLAQPGDAVFALKQGKGPKVIFGYGRLMDRPSLRAAEGEEVRWRGRVRFEQLVDPLDDFLISEADVRRLL